MRLIWYIHASKLNHLPLRVYFQRFANFTVCHSCSYISLIGDLLDFVQRWVLAWIAYFDHSTCHFTKVKIGFLLWYAIWRCWLMILLDLHVNQSVWVVMMVTELAFPMCSELCDTSSEDILFGKNINATLSPLRIRRLCIRLYLGFLEFHFSLQKCLFEQLTVL